jgi:hypothetical protein
MEQVLREEELQPRDGVGPPQGAGRGEVCGAPTVSGWSDV